MRRESLTGGSGDVSPQLMNLSTATLIANTYHEITVPIPIARFQQRKGKAIVFEVLKTYWDLAIKDNNFAAGGEASQVFGQLSTVSKVAVDSTDPRVFSWANKEYRGAFTAAGSYSTVIIEPFVHDLTDGAGHGYLLGTDNVFLGVNTTNFAGTAGLVCKILYRFKEVNLDEYIGIVQSQQ
jgi:hypothetical protein